MEQFTIERILADAVYGQILLCHITKQSPNRKVVIKRVLSKLASMQLNMQKGDKVHENIAFEKLVYRIITTPQTSPEEFERDEAPQGQQKIESSTTNRHSLFHHPHIVRYYMDFEQNGHEYLVMEHVPHELYQVYRQHGRFPIGKAQQYIKQILLGIAYLHQKGIAHRDLSLENILLDRYDQCKICDFGLAATAGTLNHQAVGKPYYIAPEILDTNTHGYLPEQADMWSLGIMFFIMVTGTPFVEIPDSSDTTFQEFKHFGLKQLLVHWGYHSSFGAEGVDFLAQLLSINPSNRLSSDQALHHPFISSLSTTSPISTAPQPNHPAYQSQSAIHFFQSPIQTMATLSSPITCETSPILPTQKVNPSHFMERNISQTEKYETQATIRSFWQSIVNGSKRTTTSKRY